MNYTDYTPVVGKKKDIAKFNKVRGNSDLLIMPKYDGTMVISLPEVTTLPLRGNKGEATTRIMTKQGKAIPNVELRALIEDLLPPLCVAELHVNNKVNQSTSLISDESADPSRFDWQLVVFNLLRDDLPMLRRLQIANNLIEERQHPKLTLADYSISQQDTESALSIYQGYYETKVQNLEGLVVTHVKAPLVVGKPGKTNWHAFKHIPLESTEFEITGVEEAHYGKDLKTVDPSLWGKPKGFAGSLVLTTPSGTKFKVGTGFTQQQRKSIWTRRDEMIGYYAEVEYMTMIKDVPRTPRFKDIRTGPSGARIII
jgi:hypothetical protein